MNHDQTISRAREDLAQVLTRITVGTIPAAPGEDPRPRKLSLLALAAQHLDDWLSTNPPPNNLGPRGGTSTSQEREDRTETAALHHQTIRDVERLPELVTDIAAMCDELHRLVVRNTAVIHHDKLPADLPRCRSCARAGHFAPVRADVPSHQLCDWCYRHALAHAAGRPLSRSDWPPKEACDRLARSGPQAAGRWLARQTEAAS